MRATLCWVGPLFLAGCDHFHSSYQWMDSGPIDIYSRAPIALVYATYLFMGLGLLAARLRALGILVLLLGAASWGGAWLQLTALPALCLFLLGLAFRRKEKALWGAALVVLAALVAGFPRTYSWRPADCRFRQRTVGTACEIYILDHPDGGVPSMEELRPYLRTIPLCCEGLPDRLYRVERSGGRYTVHCTSGLHPDVPYSGPEPEGTATPAAQSGR